MLRQFYNQGRRVNFALGCVNSTSSLLDSGLPAFGMSSSKLPTLSVSTILAAQGRVVDVFEGQRRRRRSQCKWHDKRENSLLQVRFTGKHHHLRKQRLASIMRLLRNLY